MSMTIGEASAVATVLHWLAQDKPVDSGAVIDAVMLLNERAAKPLQLSNVLAGLTLNDATSRVARVRTLQIYQGRDGQWYWRAVAPNGRTTAQGEGHTRKADAERAARAEYPGCEVQVHVEPKADLDDEQGVPV